MQPQNLNLNFYLPKVMIQILKLCLHKQTIQKTKVYLNFGSTVAIVMNPTTLFQTVFENNSKMRKKTQLLFSMEMAYKVIQ